MPSSGILDPAHWIGMLARETQIDGHLDPSQRPQAEGRVVADPHPAHSRIAWLHQRHL
jgi:hypothetical protein